MGQEIVTGTGLSSSLRSALGQIANAQPGERSSISSKTMTEAREAAAGVEQALRPAPPEVAERWLEALGVLCAASPQEADAARKVRAIALMLEFPARCFNRASLNAAARRFKFFPSYSEVCEHLEAEASELKRLRHDLRRLMSMPVEDDRQPPRYSDLSDEQRAEVDRHLASLRSLSTRQEIVPQDRETQKEAT